MKKILVLFLMFCFVSPVMAYQPSWSEFCPSEYTNSSSKHNPASYILRITRENNKECDYWVNRKADFENQVNYAMQLPQDQRENYYQQIRIAESNKNNVHYQSQQNYLAKQGLMLQRFNTIQMMNTNNNLNGINNNLNRTNNYLKYGY